MTQQGKRERTTASLNDLEVAQAWLECNEGDEGQREACQRVAFLLGKMMLKRFREAAVKIAVKEHGVTPTQAREAIRRAALSGSRT